MFLYGWYRLSPKLTNLSQFYFCDFANKANFSVHYVEWNMTSKLLSVFSLWGQSSFNAHSRNWEKMVPTGKTDHCKFGPAVTVWISRCLNLFKWSINSACLLCLIIQGSRCVERYLEKDSRIIQNLRASKDVTFIAFTVCPSFDDAYNGTMLEVHGTNKDIYKRGSTK